MKNKQQQNAIEKETQNTGNSDSLIRNEMRPENECSIKPTRSA
jgi:hypothetical protein